MSIRYAFPFALLLVAAPAFAQEGHDHHATHADHAAPSGLTMKQVMGDLAAQLGRIQQGLLSGNRYMVQQGAEAIAAHPAPDGGIKPYVKKNAERLKETIPVMDRQVHQTATELAEKAMTAPMGELAAMSATITGGCVGCHDLFRDGE
ncbi:MAG: hypothetical protein HQK87_10915 [Nitrospinae bacterium]|nr:hypothetical protein [Nitrospinota bacterium]